LPRQYHFILFCARSNTGVLPNGILVDPKVAKEPLPGVNNNEVLKASQMLQLIKQLPIDQYDKLFKLLMVAGQCK